MRNFLVVLVGVLLAGAWYLRTGDPAPAPAITGESQAVTAQPAEPSEAQVSGGPADAEQRGGNTIQQVRFNIGDAPQIAYLYVPPEPEFDHPLLMLIDPNGQAGAMISRWRPAAEKYGWYLVATPVIRNGSSDAADDAAKNAIFDYLRESRHVDWSRVIFGGFSGGGCAAYRFALLEPGKYRGAIVENGHTGPWRDLGAGASGDLKFFLFGRSNDFNAEPMRALHRVMDEKGFTTKFVERPGEHEPMSPDDAVEALAWFDEQL
jgi:predicted esterase